MARASRLPFPDRYPSFDPSRSPLATPPYSLPPVEILLIEDNPANISIFHEALKECEIPCQVSVLKNRSDVLAFVRRAGVSAHAPYQLIIIDFSIPGIEVEEIMAALRSIPAYKDTPAIVFSAFDESEGQRRCAQCGATAFVPKAGDLRASFDAIHAIVRRWGRQDNGTA